jgi:hypothetical protein
MAMQSLTDFSLFLKQQIRAQEQVTDYLWKLEALIAVVMTDDNFYDLSKNILHNYFSTIDYLIMQTAKVNQTSLDALLQQER